MTSRFAIAALLGVCSFALVTAGTLDGLCYLKFFDSCTGSVLQPWALLIFGVGAVFILFAGLIINLAIRRATWYRTWQTVPLYVLASVALPKLYIIVTGSDFSFTDPFLATDGVFAVAGLVMGVVLFVLFHQRSNSGVQPTPASGRG
jgi:hypothetical protein